MARKAWMLAVALVACGGSSGEAELFGGDPPDAGQSSEGGSGDTDSGSAADGGSSDRVCAPGKVEACPCPGGGQGAQACRDDGTGFEPCECGSGGGDDAGADAPVADDGGPTDAGPDAPWGDGGDYCGPAHCAPFGGKGINCDPACGYVSPQCVGSCNSSKPYTVPEGVSWIRTPSVTEKGCTECNPPVLGLWNMVLATNAVPHCLTITGPDGAVIIPDGWSAPGEFPNLCYGSPTGNDDGCWTTRVKSPGGTVLFHIIGLRKPNPGALFRIELRNDPDSCPEAQCVGGCNGDGALAI